MLLPCSLTRLRCRTYTVLLPSLQICPCLRFYIISLNSFCLIPLFSFNISKYLKICPACTMVPSLRLQQCGCNCRISSACRYRILPAMKTKTEILHHLSQTMISFPVPSAPAGCCKGLLLGFFSFLFTCLSVLTHYLLLRLFFWSARP